MTRNAKKIRRNAAQYNERKAAMREANDLNSYYANHGGKPAVVSISTQRDTTARNWWRDYVTREQGLSAWTRDWLLDMAAGE